MQRTVNPCRKTMWERYPPDQPYGTVAQLARASDCLSEGRGFEPHQSRGTMLETSTWLYWILTNSNLFYKILANK